MSQTDTSGKRSNEHNDKRKKMVFLWLLIPLLIMVVLTNGLSEINPTIDNPFDQHATQKASALPLERPESIDIPGYPQVINIEAGHTHSYIDLHNPETNDVHLSFALRLNASDDADDVVLYESGLVRPGYTITQQELRKTLDKGVYEASIHIRAHMYDDDTGDVIDLNGVRNVLTFEVE